VSDHEADFIHVGRDGDRVIRVTLERGDDVSHRVGANAVGAIGELAADDLADFVFVSRDASGLSQLTEQIVIKLERHTHPHDPTDKVPQDPERAPGFRVSHLRTLNNEFSVVPQRFCARSREVGI